MNRVVAIWVLLAVQAAVPMAACAAAGATIPPGPRLAVIREGRPARGLPPVPELLNVSPTGSGAIKIARASGGIPFPTTGFAWSADGARLGFGWSPGLPPGDPIYTLPAEGGRAAPVRGTRGGFSAVFSPNGRALAFARERSHSRGRGRGPGYAMSIWVVDARGGRPRQLTPWRDGQFLGPSSFAPDGTTLIGVRSKLGNGPDVVSVDLDNGHVSLVVENGAQPTYSPDGSTIAFVRRSEDSSKQGTDPELPPGDLYVASADGSNERRLTFDPALGEGQPSWDPSGERLVFTQSPPRGAPPALLGGPGSAILEINADGTCQRRLLFGSGISYWEAAWQPGPGRGAGRIDC